MAQASEVEQGQAASDAWVWGGDCTQAAPGALLPDSWKSGAVVRERQLPELSRELAASCPGREPPSFASF